jgi:hypothetical protein
VQFDFDAPVSWFSVHIKNRSYETSLSVWPQRDGRWRAQSYGGSLSMNLPQNTVHQYTLTQIEYPQPGSQVTEPKVRTYQGTFRTLSNHVTVRVDSVDLHAFRPVLGDELEIRLEVNPGEPGRGGAREIRGMIPARRTFRIGEEIATVITSRRETRPGCYEVRRPAEPGERYFETIKGYVDACVEVGVAKIAFDLSTPEFRGPSARKQFTVNGGNPGPDDMKFAAHGSIAVRQPKDPTL